jgi:lysophospholipase L1-like esterase
MAAAIEVPMSLTAKLMLSPVLVAQAIATRARLPRLAEPAGQRHGVAGQGTPLRLLIAGDSSAAGVGVEQQRNALAQRLAKRLAEAVGARVAWQLHARSGLTTAQTLALLRDEEHAPGALQADLAVVVTGVNDVVEQIPSGRAVAARDALANWLRNGHGIQHVVFAPLPPVHHFPGLPQPLRWVAGADARRHNAALVEWAATRRDVSCVDMEMPLNRGVMARDGFHPGEPVYRYCANAIAQHIATHVWPELHLHRPDR